VTPVAAPMPAYLVRTAAGLSDHLPRNLLRIAPLGQCYDDDVVIESINPFFRRLVGLALLRWAAWALHCVA
jgi:hypothetical protein